MLCLVRDDARIEVDRYDISRFDLLSRLRTFQDRQPDIDRIYVEYPCKCLGNDAVYSAGLDRYRRMLSLRSASKILAADHNIALFDLIDKVPVDVFHAVGRQFFVICRVQMSRGDYHVCIYIIPILVYGSSCFHFGSSFARAALIFHPGRRFCLRLLMLPPLPGRPDILLIPHVPFCRRSFCSS